MERFGRLARRRTWTWGLLASTLIWGAGTTLGLRIVPDGQHAAEPPRPQVLPVPREHSPAPVEASRQYVGILGRNLAVYLWLLAGLASGGLTTLGVLFFNGVILGHTTAAGARNGHAPGTARVAASAPRHPGNRDFPGRRRDRAAGNHAARALDRREFQSGPLGTLMAPRCRGVPHPRGRGRDRGAGLPSRWRIGRRNRDRVLAVSDACPARAAHAGGRLVVQLRRLHRALRRPPGSVDCRRRYCNSPPRSEPTSPRPRPPPSESGLAVAFGLRLAARHSAGSREPSTPAR